MSTTTEPHRTTGRARRVLPATAALAITAALVLGAPPAQGAAGRGAVPAAEPVVCSRLPHVREAVVEGVRIEGDLLADDDCGLVRSTVTGDILVLPGFGVALFDGTVVHGSVRGRGPVDVDGSYVHGDVHVDAPERQLWIVSSTVGGDVTGHVTASVLQSAHVHGSYDVTTTEAARFRGGSTVLGTLDTRGGRLLLHDTVVRGDVTSSGSAGALLCRARLDGALTITGLRAYARVGLEPPYDCTTTVAGPVELRDNPHSIDLGTVSTPLLVCAGNTGPRGVTVDGTQSLGATSGRCFPS